MELWIKEISIWIGGIMISFNTPSYESIINLWLRGVTFVTDDGGVITIKISDLLYSSKEKKLYYEFTRP